MSTPPAPAAVADDAMAPDAAGDGSRAPGCIRPVHVYCKAANRVDLVQHSRAIARGGSGSGAQAVSDSLKLTAKDYGPLSIEAVFHVHEAPVSLLLTTLLVKSSDNSLVMSYVENMGTFAPQETAHRFSAKECPSIPGSSFVRTVYRLIVRLQDSVTTATYFESEVPVAQRRSPFTLRDSDSSSDLAGPPDTNSGSTVATTGGSASWYHVPKLMLPLTDECSETAGADHTRHLQSRKSTVDVIRELGFWLYSSSVGQYFMRYSDERARPGDLKEYYSLSRIHMMGVTYEFRTSHESAPPPGSDMPDARDRSAVGSPTPDESSRRRRNKSSARLVPAPAVTAPAAARSHWSAELHLPRLEPLGDLFCVRQVFRYVSALAPNTLGLVRTWLHQRGYEVKWTNEFNLEAEEVIPSSLRSLTTQRNTLIMRIYQLAEGRDGVVVDVALFAGSRKGGMMAALLGQSADLGVRASESVKLVDRLFFFLDGTAASRGTLLFRDGYNANVLLQPTDRGFAALLDSAESVPINPDVDAAHRHIRSSPSATALPLTSDEQQAPARHADDAGSVSGTLMMWRSEPPAGWVRVHMSLDDGALSYGPPDNRASIPVRLAVLSVKCEGPLRFDILFNSLSYQLRADTQADYDRWRRALERVAAFVLLPEDNAVTQARSSDATPSPSVSAASGSGGIDADLFNSAVLIGPSSTPAAQRTLAPTTSTTAPASAALAAVSSSPAIAASPPSATAVEDWLLVDRSKSAGAIKSASLPQSIKAPKASGGIRKFSPTGAGLSPVLSRKGTPPPDVMASDLNTAANQQVLLAFLRDFHSRFWFTYRRDFARIEPSYFTSDTGWGCMLRTSQMLLAQAFSTIMLSREWRLHSPQTPTTLAAYKQILLWFNDQPSPRCPYSLHNLAITGVAVDKKIGEWFGPVTAAYVLRRIMLRHVDCPLSVYVSQDHTVYMDLAVAAACSATGTWRPLLLLLPVRLGVDQLNEVYVPFVAECFRFPQSVGIAGGKPCKSLYFVACQDDELFYLDPHILHPAQSVDDERIFPVESNHCSRVRRTDVHRLDPTMLIGFVCRTREDLVDFAARINAFNASAAPCIHIVDEAPAYVRDAFEEEMSVLASASSPTLVARDVVDDEFDIISTADTAP